VSLVATEIVRYLVPYLAYGLMPLVVPEIVLNVARHLTLIFSSSLTLHYASHSETHLMSIVASTLPPCFSFHSMPTIVSIFSLVIAPQLESH